MFKIDNVTVSSSEAPEGFSLSEKPWKYAGIIAALGAAMIGGLNNVTAWYASSTGRVTPVIIAFYSGLGGLFLSVAIGLISKGTRYPL